MPPAATPALTSVDTLVALLGPVRSVREVPMTTVGFTAAMHRRLAVAFDDGHEESFVLKQASTRTDWVGNRTRDAQGREVALLEEAGLASVWECVASPYVACARENGAIALLMRDLSPWLLPDVRAPLAADQENALLSALARLHARFWNRTDLPSWLTRNEDFLTLVGPRCVESPTFDAMPVPLRTRIAEGWRVVARRVPKRVNDLLATPADEVERAFMRGPRTIVHGDAKVANFAIDATSSRVWAFDWAMVGHASPGVDLGWYLAVNGSRIAESKAAALARYRARLEALRGAQSDSEWAAIERCAVVCGAFMGLWSKAMSLEANVANAKGEWDWWISSLEELG